MQIRRVVRNIGMGAVAVAIVAGVAISAVWPVRAEETQPTGNMVFFKGGFVGFNSNRGGEFFTDCGLGSNTCGQNNSSTGWYVGAGLDLVLSKDAWGMMSKTWAVGEIGLQFNRISSKTVLGGVSAATGPSANTQLTSVTIDVAPKIKFMEDSKFRPWIIPVGLDIMVISPPSNQTQYLDVGVQFGVGVEYEVWKAFKLGLDGRYHLMANMTNTNNSYGQVGPYVGISF